jgi:hypothetical protein
MPPVKYELGIYIPEDDILHSDRSENLKSYKFLAVSVAVKVTSSPSYFSRAALRILVQNFWPRSACAVSVRSVRFSRCGTIQSRSFQQHWPLDFPKFYCPCNPALLQGRARVGGTEWEHSRPKSFNQLHPIKMQSLSVLLSAPSPLCRLYRFKWLNTRHIEGTLDRST